MRKLFYLVIAAALMLIIMPVKGEAAGYTGKDVVNIAKKYKGVPYVFGGTTPKGFDCSGYLTYVFKQVGVSLPRTAEEQYNKVGTKVEKKNLQPGDLVFFSNTYKAGISHAGIYVGDNSFISSTTSKGVEVVSLDNSYWKPKYTGAKRVFNDLPEGEFIDLPNNHFSFTAVKTLSTQGVINGFDDGTFRPSTSVTRGQAAAIVNRVLKHTASDTTSFSDVAPSDGFAKDIAAIQELGIINGYADGTFRPNETMTRGQMAVIVKNAFNISHASISNESSSTIYADVKPSYWSYDAIVSMNLIDRTTGFKTTTFRPGDKATRGDFSAAVYNGINL